MPQSSAITFTMGIDDAVRIRDGLEGMIPMMPANDVRLRWLLEFVLLLENHSHDQAQ